MFDSLDETIRHDDLEETTPKQRIIKATIISVVSVLLFGALYLAVRLVG